MPASDAIVSQNEHFAQDRYIRITHQGELVKIDPLVSRAIFPHRFGRGDRAPIIRFSEKSRKNLLERFAIIDQERSRSAKFITLTYVSNQQDHALAALHVREFLRRVMRDHPASFAVWKKELQDRGAIHFHLIIWNMPFIPHEELKAIWGDITGETDAEGRPPFIWIVSLKGRRRVWYYVSKYVGKAGSSAPSEETTIEQAANPDSRREGLRSDASGGYPCQGEEAGSFNNATNLHTGRWWGWVGRKNIPYAEVLQATIETTWKAFHRFRWDLRRAFPFTGQIHVTHRVKLFWFDPDLSPIWMLLAGMAGEPCFNHALPP